MARMHTVLYLRFLINYVKQSRTPRPSHVQQAEIICRPRKGCVYYFVDVVGTFCVEVEHAGNNSRRGSDIASMHSLKLYSSRPRILDGR